MDFVYLCYGEEAIIMRLSKTRKEELIALVLEQIEADIQNGETDAIFALLQGTKRESLLGFLPNITLEYFAEGKI